MKRFMNLLSGIFTILVFSANAQQQGDPKSTEVWEPIPKLVNPGKQNHQPPSDAIILFNGKDLSEWITIKNEPAKWNVLINASKEISPLLNAGISTVYAPQVNMLIIIPTCRYNLRPNLEVDLFWQSFFVERSHFQALAHTGTLRFKWSF